jgi:hypothetical protein
MSEAWAWVAEKPKRTAAPTRAARKIVISNFPYFRCHKNEETSWNNQAYALLERTKN